MISLYEFFKKKTFFFFPLMVFIFSISINAYGSTLPFDEYAVFCSYFKISKDEPSDQDIEELCFTFDRPTYTAFKPSEMFSKKSLLKEKSRVDEIMKSITDDSTFLWKMQYNLSEDKDIKSYLSATAINERLPQPTPYINSRICANGHQKIKKAVSSLLKSRTEKFNGKAFEIIITLKPEKYENVYQKRNIVREHVVLPIRYVIFRPIEVQILDETEIIK